MAVDGQGGLVEYPVQFGGDLAFPIARADLVSQRDTCTLHLALNCTMDFPTVIRPMIGALPSFSTPCDGGNNVLLALGS